MRGSKKYMNYEKLDAKAILSWRVRRTISFLFLIVTVGVGLLILTNIELDSKYKKYIYIVIVLLLLYKLIGIIIYPIIEYKQWRYAISKDKVEIRHGIFFITTTVIPIIRVQHITISKGPIYRKMGLAAVKIFLASGSFEIEGLSENNANIISESLKSSVMERLNMEYERGKA